MGTFQLSLLLGSALGETIFAVLWRLGAGEDPKQIGFWAEPSVSPVSVGALLFAEHSKRVGDELLELEAVFVDRTVDGLVQVDGTFVIGVDVVAAEDSRSIASIDIPTMLMRSASDDAGLVVFS